MTDATSDSRADHFPIPLKVYCSFGAVAGIASFIDISYSGALLGNTGLRPEVGTRIQFYLHLKPPCASEASKPSELAGVVIRHSSDGFAVEFEESRDPVVREMLGAAAAIMAGGR